MYNHTLRINGEFLASAQQMPANTQVTGNGGVSRAGSMCGAAEVVVKAVAPVTLAAGKSFTLHLEHGDAEDSLSVMPVAFTRQYTDGLNATAGDIIARLPVPSDAGRYVRALLGTDDAAASGTVDVFMDFIPR
ncbi:hypothetical protein [Oleidesulfovibrio sp.]|uniref:hypothetical protein n=1 Tax=Oleidesulfovibrio sp. TaxID=2909707 RepID=UPI003A858C69